MRSLAAFGLIMFSAMLVPPPHSMRTLTVSRRLGLVAERRITRAPIDSAGAIYILTHAGTVLVTPKSPGQPINRTRAPGGVQVAAGHIASSSADDPGPLLTGAALLLLSIMGLGLLYVACLLFANMRRRRGDGDRVLGQTQAATSAPATQVITSPVRFRDVAGVEEAKADLEEIVAFLKAPQRYRTIGARMPKGVLLSGPPGTGKTLLARAVAGEVGVPFLSISGSAFVEMYVGVGAARVRDLFARARQTAPAVVFIDELDAVGGKRSAASPGGNSERESTLNQLLVEMDGFEQDARVVILAATNRPDMLDPALLRPGRFDRRVELSLPDRAGRRAVLELHAEHVRLSPEVDLDTVAAQTSGMSPAELANLINEAALLAARTERTDVTQHDIDAAMLRVLAGPELTSRVLPPALKRVIAYHEVGHALVMKHLKHCDPVVKVQAIARGNALGLTVSRPQEDQYLLTRSALLERMVGIMGGRAAEESFFDEVTTGAQQDIQQANAIARRMVMEFGMSPLGHICVGEGAVISGELAAKIDDATGVLVEQAYAQALDIVTEQRDVLGAIAEHLCEVETMDGDELDRWLKAYPGSRVDASRAS
jgi:cell division protease FtsH